MRKRNYNRPNDLSLLARNYYSVTGHYYDGRPWGHWLH